MYPLVTWLQKTINLPRTRNGELLQKAISDPEVFVLDVGDSYDGEKRNFDHHQENVPEGMSTISMIFFYLLPYYADNDILNKVYNRLIIGINDWDQGKADRSIACHLLHLPQFVM